MKRKRPSTRALQQNVKFLRAEVERLQGLTAAAEQVSLNYREYAEQWKKKAQERVDTTMIAERRQIASSLAQMTEALAYAVKFVIGKEVI